MMIMNVFPIGFVFPKQDFIRPAKQTADSDKAAAVKADIPSTPSEDDSEKSFGMPLFAYRFL